VSRGPAVLAPGHFLTFLVMLVKHHLLQFLSEWLARDPGRLGASFEQFVGHPAYGLPSSAMAWSASSSCSAAATASPCSARSHGPALSAAAPVTHQRAATSAPA
jgi:hypothetical protein